MRNLNQATVETVTQWRDQAGALWCAQIHYPKGKLDPYWVASVSMVGTTVSIPCASMAQLWHEIGIRQNKPMSGF
jgi:hypothetical protein